MKDYKNLDLEKNNFFLYTEQPFSKYVNALYMVIEISNILYAKCLIYNRDRTYESMFDNYPIEKLSTFNTRLLTTYMKITHFQKTYFKRK